MIYVDTSVLTSLYLTDGNSARADSWRQAHPEPLPISSFHRLELANAFSLAVFQGRLTQEIIEGAWADFEHDLNTKALFPVTSDLNQTVLRATGFSRNHSPLVGTRTLDTFHVALAIDLNATEFFTFDKRQQTLASKVGLRITH